MGSRRSFTNLGDSDQSLVMTALKASAHAYAPYSGFAVGAAVRVRSGRIYAGANLENASYGLSICAEISAVTLANTAGEFDLEAIAVVGHKFTEPRDAGQIVTPCGRCRQIICEAGQVANVDVRVLSCNGDLTQIFEARISELLPEAFGPKNLGLDAAWPKMRSKLAATLHALIERERSGVVEEAAVPLALRSER
jgi:cytidine deaminase